MVDFHSMTDRRTLTRQITTRKQARSWRQTSLAGHLAVALLFAVLSVVMTWPLARDLQYTLISWGDPVFQMWTLAWNWHALTTDPLSIFDANVFYPWHNTLAYSDHLFGQTLLVLPVLALTENGILADNISVLLAFALSGFAMYLLVYDITGNRIAGILAGTAYAFAPSRMAHLEHLHLLSGQWLPLALLFLRRAVGSREQGSGNGRRSWWYVGLGATFFAQGLSGVYFFYFLIAGLVIAGAVYVVIALLNRDPAILRRLGLAALACAVAGVLLIPTLWPYQEVHNDLGIEREREKVNVWSATGTDYLAVWSRNRLYNGPLGEFHRDIERDLFPGLLVTGLALVGLTHPRFRQERWLLLAMVAGPVILSFGLSGTIFGVEIPLPYEIFYDYLPGFRAIRVPARFGLLALVGLAGLAGLGADRLWKLGRRRIPARWRTAGGLALLAVGLAVLILETLTIMELPDRLPVNDPPPAYAYIAENPAPTIELPMGDGPVASAWPNFWSTMHWNRVANGYSGIVPPNYDLLRERSKDFPSPETVALFQGIGIQHVIVHADFPEDRREEVEAQLAANPDIQQVLSGPDAIYDLAPNPWIWEMADAVPEGETVDLPRAGNDPLTAGMMVAILQRTGHTVTGQGTIGYLELSPPSSPRCYAILPETGNPADSGYRDVAPVISEAGYTLYRNAGCE